MLRLSLLHCESSLRVGNLGVVEERLEKAGVVLMVYCIMYMLALLIGGYLRGRFLNGCHRAGRRTLERSNMHILPYSIYCEAVGISNLIYHLTESMGCNLIAKMPTSNPGTLETP